VIRPMDATTDARPTTRRTFLAGGAALVGAVLAGCAGGGGDGDDDAAGGGGDAGGTTAATGDATTTTAAGAEGATTLTADDFAALGTCLLAPEQTQGPFFADVGLERRDITEGLAGHPLRLGIRVVDEDCNPVAGALVDVWHCDVDGDYSAFQDGSGAGDDGGEGTTFLRGSQVADAAGIVEFATNYPGWYQGRAVHIHTKVRLDGTEILTTQLYFPEDLTDEVHAEDPYAAHGTRDTRNEDDAIAGDPAAAGNLLTASAAGSGTLGLVVLGVDPDG
jgi:protocatechuate 3,4-dioxygenase beta subunit